MNLSLESIESLFMSLDRKFDLLNQRYFDLSRSVDSSQCESREKVFFVSMTKDEMQRYVNMDQAFDTVSDFWSFLVYKINRGGLSEEKLEFLEEIRDEFLKIVNKNCVHEILNN